MVVRKILCFILSAAILLAVFPVYAFAQQKVELMGAEMPYISEVSMTVNGQRSEKLAFGTIVSAVDVDHTTGAADVMLLTSVYRNGKLTDIRTDSRRFGIGESGTLTTTINLAASGNIDEYAVYHMIWNDTDSIRPYTQPAVHTCLGRVPLERAGVSGSTRPITRSDVKNKVNGAICMMPGEPYALVNQAKAEIDASNKEVAPVVRDGTVMVPVRFLAQGFGGTVSYDLKSGKMTILYSGKTIELVYGSDKAYINTVQQPAMKTAAVNIGNRLFIPADAFAQLFSKYVYTNDMDIIVISNKSAFFNYDSEFRLILNTIAEINYDRPTGTEMLADLMALHPGDAHPRLLATQADFDAIKQNAKTDSTLASWISKVESNNAYMLNAALPVYGVDAGGRMLDTARSAKERIFVMALLYKVTGKEQYAIRVWKDMDAVSSFPSWHPGHFLDCGELSFGMAIGYDWLYDYLTPAQRSKVETAIYNFSIKAGLGAYAGTTEDIEPAHGTFGRSGWTTTENNWNAVCNGGLTMSCVALAYQYSADVADLLGKIITSTELGMYQYAPDGGYSEGPGYWSYGTNYLVLLMASLDSGMGTNYGIFKAPGISQTGYYTAHIEGTEGQWNYHDCGEGYVDTSTLFWFADKLDNPDLGGIRYNHLTKGTKGVNARDILWYRKAKVSANVQMPLDYNFKGIDTVTMRSDWNDSGAIYTGLHAGANNVNHSNLDMGNFIIDARDERFICDLSGDNYNLAGYFSSGTGGQRWNYYRMRAEGQNTLVINPSKPEDQVVNARARITGYVSAPRGAYAIADLSPGYAAKVNSAKRGLMLADNRQAIIIQDEVSLKAPSEVWWFAHTKGKIAVAGDGRSAIITVNGKRLWAGIVSPMADAKFIDMEAMPLSQSPGSFSGENSRTQFRKLAIQVTNVTDYKLAVVFKPLETGQSAPLFDYTFTDMAEWTIPGAAEVPPVREEFDSVTASDYQDGNPPENSQDGDLNTRWSAEGEQWIQYTFAEAKEISTAWLAFWKSAERKANIEIQVSGDGTVFHTVFKGQNSLNTDVLEPFSFPKQTVKAVKIICRGNTFNMWNSILEVDFS